MKITQFLCPMFTLKNLACQKVETSSTIRQANFLMCERFSLEIFLCAHVSSRIFQTNAAKCKKVFLEGKSVFET